MFWPLDNVDPPDGPDETAFRRGFHHGANYAYQAILEGKSIEEIRKWVEEDVMAWRNNTGTPAYPPDV